MKRITFILILWSGFFNICQGQISSGLLKGDIYQNNAVNPAYFPASRWMISVPVLSGTSFNYNNRLSYSDAISKLDNGVNQVNFNNILRNLKEKNFIGLHTRVNLLFVGYRRNQAAISFFVNERIEADLFFPKDLVDFGINGNLNFTGRELNLRKLRGNATHYREMGVGYTYFDKEGRFSVGYRLKLLSGFYNASTPNNFNATLTTNADNFSLDIHVENAIFRNTEVYSNRNGTSFILSRNLGASLDIGASYKLNEQLSIGFSITDLGFISWKDGIDGRQLEDTNFTYGGVDIRNSDDLIEALEDSISGRFNIIENYDEPYTTALPAIGNITGSWHLNANSELIATVIPRFVLGNVQMQYGAGISQKISRNLKVNLSANKLPQQNINLGAALALYLGPIQIYGGTDRIIDYDLTTLRQFNYTFGINLALGRGKIKKTKAYSPSKFRLNGGEEIKVRGKDKIYLIIPKQKRKKPVNQ